MRWCVSRTPFNQWAASSSSNYCSGSPSPSLGNLSITHFHFFPRSHKSLVLSLLQSPSKRPRGSLDTCVNNRWQVPPPPTLYKDRTRECVYVFLLRLNCITNCLDITFLCSCIYCMCSLCCSHTFFSGPLYFFLNLFICWPLYLIVRYRGQYKMIQKNNPS